MTSWLHRPRSASSTRATLITCFVAPGVITAIGDVSAWPQWLTLLGWPVAMIVASHLVWTRWNAASVEFKGFALALCLASLFWTIAMLLAFRSTLLAVVGVSVDASVVDQDITRVPSRSGGYDLYCYSLQRIDGSSISGRICRYWAEFGVGDTMQVLVDPTGLVAPETPEGVAGVRPWQILGLVSLVATLALGWINGGFAPSTRRSEENQRRVRNQVKASSPGPSRSRPRRRRK
jgi:hypothetical protein